MKLNIFPESAYRLSLFPIVGDEANAIIDEEGFDYNVDLVDCNLESV
ncbi:MAG: hypothetical protein K6A67_06545 [Bacteroidales bacterium]|nr:hypothetical protein [Bacteroidales bacterium]